VRVAPLVGGTASAVHAVDVRNRAGTVHALVLRRHVLLDDPDPSRHEAAALELLAPRPFPTPRLVAVTGGAVLMTRLPGELVWRPADVEAYLRRLTAVLPEIHATPAPPGLPPYAPYPLTARPPRGLERAFALFHGPQPSRERRFVHRDYHPGNVLWRRGAITSIVDWAMARAGPPEVDVGHCRANLVSSLGLAAADRFRDAWLSEAGRDGYDPYWDVVAVLGGCDGEGVAALDAGDRALLVRADV
jgi:aminoglycoside phosphotransferase (APT) family kinase protein